MNVRSGITSKTPESIFIDAGAVYLDYGLPSERLLGATRGGNEFNLNRVVKNIEADGLKGSVKGMKRVTEVNPQITANLIELTVENLIAAIAGANQAQQTIVKSEYVGVGDNSEKEFTLDHKPVLENSEKIYLDGTLKSRSKKYSSRFVGANVENNKGFVDGTGDWAKGDAADTIELATGGQSGNCLKFTAGASAVVEFLKLAGGDGAVLTNLVVGQHYRLQFALTKLTETFTPTITVACDAGSKTTITPTNAWVIYVIEFTATGTDATITFTGSVAPTTGDILYIDSLELERVDGDYVMNWIEGKVVFATAPTDTDHIIASYTWTTDAATHITITGGEIADADYIDNVAIVGNVSGKNYPAICIVKNALADAGFTLSTAPRDEAVPVIVFTGHYDPSDLDTEPWEIRWPKS